MKVEFVWLLMVFIRLGFAQDCSGPFITTNVKACGGLVVATSSSETGEIKSPNYPSNYTKMDKCIWRFVAPQNYSVQLTVPSFAGQEGFNNTCRDYLEIRDGSFKETLLAQICSTTASTVVQSRSRWLWVKFYSDYEEVNTGFTATWKLVYHGWNPQKDPQCFTGCRTPAINCPNHECVPWSYRCDGVNDCGYVGDGSDEDYWCDYKFIGQPLIYAWGFGTGAILCLLVFLLALCLEGYCSCCCPNGFSQNMKCYKCMKRLSGKSARSERKNWPTYMRNPAILRLTGDTEGWQDYEKFDKDRDQKKYEKIKKLKEEQVERDKVRLSTADLGSAVSMSEQGTNNNKSGKKGATNLAYEHETSKSGKKLTRQSAFNYEEQPQIGDVEFKDGLTPSASRSPSPDPGARKTIAKKNSKTGSMSRT